ncbi:hypothetical protein I317_04198 [Kwoniella heveanensis CBS 569]|nr:hypothetical protein I317_04198 [Kwoniella heveanensis CBS 569]
MAMVDLAMRQGRRTLRIQVEGTEARIMIRITEPVSIVIQARFTVMNMDIMDMGSIAAAGMDTVEGVVGVGVEEEEEGLTQEIERVGIRLGVGLGVGVRAETEMILAEAEAIPIKPKEGHTMSSLSPRPRRSNPMATPSPPLKHIKKKNILVIPDQLKHPTTTS